MKINKWTAGLAAVGLVSLASVAQAEEKSVPLMTALSSTIISGYIDTSAVWNPGTGNANPAPVSFNTPSKQDGFNLNVVNLTLEKPLDEAQWSAGYKTELLFGPDAVGYNNSSSTTTNSSGDNVYGSSSDDSDFAIKQAYIALRMPVGNGLDVKMGVFDSPLGYESFASGNNPNYTRSYGYTIEPTQLTGVSATYVFCDVLSGTAGVANTLNTGINTRSEIAESSKAYFGSVTLTAPESMGVLAGSALYAGIINGFGGTQSDGDNKNQVNIYVGATVATGVKGLKVGACYDQAQNFAPYLSEPGSDYVNASAVYASFQATEKMSLHVRGEYAKNSADHVYALTGTIQYDLWQNVVSRLEIRWDKANSSVFGGTSSGPESSTNPNGGDLHNAVMVALNLVYKF